MPELPDVTVYVESLAARVLGDTLQRVRVLNPFVLRTVQPSIDALTGRVVRGYRRIGKRIVWHFSGERYLVFHLMIAGRFHWKKVGARPSGKNDLAAFAFADGTLLLTEAGPVEGALGWAYAGALGFALVYLGEHYVIDLIAGAVLVAVVRRGEQLAEPLADAVSATLQRLEAVANDQGGLRRSAT